MDGTTVNIDQAVIVNSVGVLIYQTAGVDASHFGRVQGLNFLERALVGVAPILRQEKRQAVAFEELDLLTPSRLGKGGGITPGIVVEGEEVTALVIGTAVHIEGHLVTVGVDIGLKW